MSNFFTPGKSTASLRRVRPTDRDFILDASRVFEKFGPYVEIINGWLTDPWIEVMVLETDGTKTGFIFLGPLFPSYFRATVDIMAIYVRPEARGRGLAKRMLRWAEARALAAGYLTLRAHVGCENEPALSLFKSTGFKVIKKIENYYPSGLAAYELRKRLLKENE